jgi:hypothetical protein
MPNNSGAPSWKSIQFFESAVTTHGAVDSLTNRGENVFIIDRKRHSQVTVYLTDIYTVGIADVIDIIKKIPNLNCVVTISNWNGYTMAAKEHGIENKIGVFQFSEFMGALNRADFWSYVKRDEKGKSIYYFRG